MASLDEKKKVVAELEEKLKTSKAAVFADYRGIKVAEATDLRSVCRDAGVEFKVVKNTLTQIAAENSGFPELNQFLEGPTAIAFDYEDPVAPAKTLMDFIKKNRKLEIKGGLIEGEIVGLSSIKELADLPSRDVLVSMVLRGLNGPLTGLSCVLQGPIRKLVYALKAVQDQKAAG
ncbi:MAG TPA: 50S ribosomal protein L10 [Syntrophaceticus sp.]|jgi:large subunit ribosomal protein L10|uniref:Large ribosomal subunit protein uL10 n=1 Tax=Syntrophaceticus schinkii TaxID=499207 RepID=A0A0B7MR12_9FIRM|nr:50S ribosomal protein L10 [Syntrophaceticus schinkii]HHY30937.1 50S ribosomal protein L10 [Syntrophaceticus sp.]MDD2360207.1 50S ribosomal protein L10 [Syntrophaceticus schinkii]MDD4262124.1 50S ribosomal protein L10 [Syntrophaceticus schinkii]MDD4674864.1 50S ribosomal protein L10 [Syntrophaceticus schinkii]CEO90137.1 50S ribosomal protein L10 [Syntrophaceticus schinkii]